MSAGIPPAPRHPVLLSVGVISLLQAGAPHPTRPPLLSLREFGYSPRVLVDDEVWVVLLVYCTCRENSCRNSTPWMPQQLLKVVQSFRALSGAGVSLSIHSVVHRSLYTT